MLLCNQDVHLMNYLTMNLFGGNSGVNGLIRFVTPELLTVIKRIHEPFDTSDQQKSPQKIHL